MKRGHAASLPTASPLRGQFTEAHGGNSKGNHRQPTSPKKNARHPFHGQGLALPMPGTDPNVVDSETEYAPLHTACLEGNQEAVVDLLRRGAAVDLPGRHGWTPLQVACIMGAHTIVEVLAEAKANVNHRDHSGSTPAHKAASHGHRLCLQMLLRYHADVGMRDDRAWSPVHAASFHGHLNCVTLLRRNEVDLSLPDKTGHTPLHYAVAENNFGVVKYLLKHCTQGILIAATAQGETPLDLSVRLSRKRIRHYLEFAATEQTDEAEERLALHSAAARGDLNATKRLLDEGVFIDHHDEHGSTALHKAAGHGNSAIVRYLIRRGANRSAVNFYGELAYDVALRYAHDDCAALLEPMDPDAVAISGNVAGAYARDREEEAKEEEEAETPAQRQAKLRGVIATLSEDLLVAKMEYEETGGRLEDDVAAEEEERRRQQHLTALNDRMATLDGELRRERGKRERLEEVLQRASEHITELTARLTRLESEHKLALARAYWVERRPVRTRGGRRRPIAPAASLPPAPTQIATTTLSPHTSISGSRTAK